MEDAALWRIMLTLPQLESFECVLRGGFPNIDLPELKHLTKLHFTVIGEDPLFTGLFTAIKKMPSLETLSIAIGFYDNEDDVILNVVRGVAKAALSLGKDILVTDDCLTEHNRRLMITKLSVHEAATVVHQRGGLLELTLNYTNEERLFQNIAKFVRDELRRYNLILLEDTN